MVAILTQQHSLAELSQRQVRLSAERQERGPLLLLLLGQIFFPLRARRLLRCGVELPDFGPWTPLVVPVIFRVQEAKR